MHKNTKNPLKIKGFLVCVPYGGTIMEVPPRFELGNESFADSCLTTWPRYHMKLGTPCVPNLFGAGDEARTRYLHLGKVALYRMSYTRIFGASGRNRTNDTRIFSPLLYLLSYRGISSRAIAPLECDFWRPGTDSNRRPPA